MKFVFAVMILLQTHEDLSWKITEVKMNPTKKKKKKREAMTTPEGCLGRDGENGRTEP